MAKMRRSDREIGEGEARVILEKGEHGVLSMTDPEGWPYGIPLNYGLIGDGIYFHCALVGRKVDSFSADPRVSFCVVGQTRVLPAEFATEYESVIVSGRITEVFDEEKHEALMGLVRKYSAEFLREGEDTIQAEGEVTRVFRIGIDEITGKARTPSGRRTS